jgi:hypothetical protein
MSAALQNPPHLEPATKAGGLTMTIGRDGMVTFAQDGGPSIRVTQSDARDFLSSAAALCAVEFIAGRFNPTPVPVDEAAGWPSSPW